MNRRTLTIVSILHYVRLVYRSLLFVMLLISYIIYRIHEGDPVTDAIEKRPVILVITWAVFAVEMIMRFFPSRFESPGSQKQFARNYIKSGQTEIVIQDNHASVLIALLWICFNGIFGLLYVAGIADDGIMILLCSCYSVCDMICILFFCPFQSWFMKNKCCTSCRIYNWDYAMMFTPLLFVKTGYFWSLLFMSVALMLRWEIAFFRHPERFSERTNDYLQCRNCTEKLCTHKKQLRSLWNNIEEHTAKRLSFLKK